MRMPLCLQIDQVMTAGCIKFFRYESGLNFPQDVQPQLPSHIQLCVMQVDNGTTSECAALYYLENNTFVPYHVAELPICGGHTLLPDGRALIVGGE